MVTCENCQYCTKGPTGEYKCKAISKHPYLTDDLKTPAWCPLNQTQLERVDG